MAAHPELELHGMVVLHEGATVFEQYWTPYEPDDRPLVYSVSKTFAATAVGLAIAEGRFGLADRVVDLLAEGSGTGALRDATGSSLAAGSSGTAGAGTVPQEVALCVPLVPEEVAPRVSPVPEEVALRVSPVPEEVALRPSRRAAEDDRVAQLTVHHLLSMSTGHTEDTIEAMTAAPPRDWAQRFLRIRPQRPVGSCHVYNNGASFLLGELVRRHTGEDLLDYLRPRLFEPLGIDATWDRDPLGRCLGWTGLHLRTRDLAAIGELLRCDGVWQGRRLLPEGWVARATAKQIPTEDDKPEWRLGYGYQVWMGREGYRLDGAFGQFAFVLPERGMVVAIQSAQSCTQVLIDLLWQHLDAASSAQGLRDGAGSFLAAASSGTVDGGTVPEEPALPNATLPEESALRQSPTLPEEPARNERASRRAPEEPALRPPSAVPEEPALHNATVPEEPALRPSPTVPEEVALRPSRRAPAATIPTPTDSGAGTNWQAPGPVPVHPAMVDPGEEIGERADIADVTATRTDAGFELTLTAEGHPVRLSAAPGTWRRQILSLGEAEVPVALAAGADESGDLHVRLVFTDTPHTLRLRMRAGGATQAWKVNPLQGPSLAHMRAH